MRKILEYLLVTFVSLNTAYASGDDEEGRNPDFFEHKGRRYCSLSYRVKQMLKEEDRTPDDSQQPYHVQACSIRKDTEEVEGVINPDKLPERLLLFYNSSLRLAKEMGLLHKRTLTYRVISLLLSRR